MAEGLSSAMSYQPAQQFFYQKRIHVIQHMHTAKRRSCCRRSFKDSENHPQIPPTNHYFRARKQFSSGVVEGLNNKAKVTMRKSYGFRTFRIAELALYHALGKLPEPELSHRFY